CVFVGYCDDYKAWRFWNPSTKKLVISRDVIWAEDSFLYAPRLANPDTPTTPPSDHDFSSGKLKKLCTRD
ncbi:hypothetical protein FRC15_006253, partial [Serendipita sp. 397]